jgi:AraC family transcriptional regulator
MAAMSRFHWHRVFHAVTGETRLAQVGASVAINYDNPDATPEAQLRSFAGGELQGGPTPDGLEDATIAAGRVAVLTYKGPYAGISAAYHSLFGNWLPEAGEEPAEAPCCEIYLNNSREVAPEELLTEICLPLK